MTTDYEAIKSRVRLSSVVQPYVPSLKRVKDGDWKGLCPFHSEKTPSFLVHDNDGYYKCFSCGASGDCVSFVEKIELISHAEAVKLMKAEAGLEDSFLTASQKRAYETDKRNRQQKLNRFRTWRSRLISDLIDYTNAQWRIYRIAARQYRLTDTQELLDQMNSAESEATSRESALDAVESMSDNELMDWFDTMKSWQGVKNPKWYLSGWRKQLIEKESNGNSGNKIHAIRGS